MGIISFKAAQSGKNSCAMWGTISSEVQYDEFESGSIRCKFSLLYDRLPPEQGKKGGKGCFFNCEVWGDLARRTMRYFERGDKVLVVGQYETREYNDRQTGERKTFPYVNCDMVFPQIFYEEAQPSE